MNMKKLLFGICAFLILVAAACTSDTADDQLYENGVDKTKVTTKPSSS